MLTKASIISANFMHLKHEHPMLVATVVVWLVVCGGVLFVLIAADAARIHQMVAKSCARCVGRRCNHQEVT